MRSTTLHTVLALILAGLAASACDPVRPGGFDGNYPGPVRVDFSLAPEIPTMAAQPKWSFNMEARTWRLLPTRDWSYLGLQHAGGTVDVDVWPMLAGILDWSTRDLDYYSGPILVAGVLEASAFPFFDPQSMSSDPSLVAADFNHVLFVATTDMDVAPVGSAGPTIRVTRGFHVFQRACTPDGQQSFTEVPMDTVLQPVQLGWMSRSSQVVATDFFVAGCGIDATATVDLGAVAAPVPLEPNVATDVPATPLEVSALAWTPGSDGVYLLAQSTGYVASGGTHYAQIDFLPLGASAATPITTDDLAPPLTVATGGSSLLVSVKRTGGWEFTRQSVTGTLVPSQATLPVYPPDSALSPDGNVLATTDSVSFSVQFVDLRSLSTSSVLLPVPYDGHEGVPRAWSPAGDALLLEIVRNSSEEGQRFVIVPVVFTNGLPTGLGAPAQLPQETIPELLVNGSGTNLAPQYRDSSLRYFWSATGPQVLIQDADGARVYNFATQQTTPFVEATRVPPPTSPIDVVVATDQAFAWAAQCYGLGETSCRTELRRLSLSSGAINIVATADRARLFAVSPNGTRIVFADDTNLYLKTIAP